MELQGSGSVLVEQLRSVEEFGFRSKIYRTNPEPQDVE